MMGAKIRGAVVIMGGAYDGGSRCDHGRCYDGGLRSGCS